MPDKMSQYHWLKIKAIFQIYCADGIYKPLALPGCRQHSVNFSFVSLRDPVCNGWGRGPRPPDLLVDSDAGLVSMFVPSELFATKAAWSPSTSSRHRKIVVFYV